MVEHTTDVSSRLRKRLEQTSPDLLRAMVQEMAGALMGAEVDALCGVPYGERSPERVNRRNGYRERDWDTRVGSIELAVPKVREGSYFLGWLLQPRRRAEQAFVPVIADAYLAGVSTRHLTGRGRGFFRLRLSSSGGANRPIAAEGACLGPGIAVGIWQCSVAVSLDQTRSRLCTGAPAQPCGVAARSCFSPSATSNP